MQVDNALDPPHHRPFVCLLGHSNYRKLQAIRYCNVRHLTIRVLQMQELQEELLPKSFLLFAVHLLHLVSRLDKIRLPNHEKTIFSPPV